MHFFEEYKSLIRKKKFYEITLIVVFILQFAFITYCNIRLMKSHMGADASWSYLKAVLMWDAKSIQSNTWLDQTSLFLDSSLPLASVLYGITGRIMVSYGVANLVVLVGLLWALSSILKLLKIDVRGRFIALNLVLCPFLTNGFDIRNDLGYFNNVLSGPAFYALRNLIILLVIRSFILLQQKDKFDLWGIVALLLCILAGMSSGVFLVVMIFLPYVAFLVGEMFWKNDIHVLIKKSAIYAYLGIAAVGVGKVFAKYILGCDSIDATRTWTSLENFYSNVGGPFLGIMKLLGVLPVVSIDETVLSASGISFLFPMAIFATLLIAVGYGFYSAKKENNTILWFLLCVILVNFLTFGLFNAQYGSPVFEERYLISVFMILTILLAWYIQHAKKEYLFTNALSLVCLLSIIGNDMVSDLRYVTTTNDDWQMDAIMQTVNATDAGIVYFWGKGDDLLTVAKSMRVYDLGHMYKLVQPSDSENNIDKNKVIFYFNHWGDYVRYEDVSDYTGGTILVTGKDAKEVPNYILDKYTVINELDTVTMYYSEENPVDLSVGITGNISVDYPYTPGLIMKGGALDGQSYVSNGSEGFVMSGPYANTIQGVYTFTLEYEILDGNDAFFDIALDASNILGQVSLDPEKNVAKISNIQLEDGHRLEYRVYTGEGTKIRINRVVIEKQ